MRQLVGKREASPFERDLLIDNDHRHLVLASFPADETGQSGNTFGQSDDQDLDPSVLQQRRHVRNRIDTELPPLAQGIAESLAIFLRGEQTGSERTPCSAVHVQDLLDRQVPLQPIDHFRLDPSSVPSRGTRMLAELHAFQLFDLIAEGEVDRPLMLPAPAGSGRAAKEIEHSCLRGLTGFCACEVARHRTSAPLPASRKLGYPFGRPAPPSAPAARASPARPGPVMKSYLKTGSTFTP